MEELIMTNQMDVYVQTLKKQISTLQEGMELLMVAEPGDMIMPEADTSELEKALQQEKDLRVKAESSKEDIKRRFKESFEKEQSLRVKAESAAEEFKRKFEEAMAELAKEREAHQSDNLKWTDSIGQNMKKDELIEELQETIEDMQAHAESQEKTIQELRAQLAEQVKRTPDVRKNDQAIKANIKQQLDSVHNEEVPEMPAQNYIPPVEEDEVPDMNTWIHPDKTFKLFVSFQKNCANCPLVSTCDYQSKKKSEFGTDCMHLSVKEAAVAAKELHVKVSTQNNKYIFPAYTKDGVYVGDIHKNRENKDAIAELQKHRNKTVVLKTTAFKVVEDSVFTRYQAEVAEVIDSSTTQTTQRKKETDVSSASDLVFEDMSGNKNEEPTNKEETTEEKQDGLIDFGEPIAALF